MTLQDRNHQRRLLREVSDTITDINKVIGTDVLERMRMAMMPLAHRRLEHVKQKTENRKQKTENRLSC